MYANIEIMSVIGDENHANAVSKLINHSLIVE